MGLIASTEKQDSIWYATDISTQDLADGSRDLIENWKIQEKLNLYAYVNNNTLNRVDPQGLYEIEVNEDLSITVKLKHCEAIMIGGHGHTKVVNKAKAPKGEGCGARIGQDTCGNGPSNANFPEEVQIEGLPENEDYDRESLDTEKNQQANEAFKKAIDDLCKCCKGVQAAYLYVGTRGWKTQGLNEPRPETKKSIKCLEWPAKRDSFNFDNMNQAKLIIILPIISFVLANVLSFVMFASVSLANRVYNDVSLMILPTMTSVYLAWHWVFFLALNGVLIFGILQSIRANNCMPFIQVAILALFIAIIYVSIDYV